MDKHRGIVASWQAKAEADMKEIASKIPLYQQDRNRLPSCTMDSENSVYTGNDFDFCTFTREGLTTPIAYLDQYPEDPFGRNGLDHVVYKYFSCHQDQPMDPDDNSSMRAQASGWIIVSPGPDREFNVQLNTEVWNDPDLFTNFLYTYTATELDISDDYRALKYLQYDPTNGVFSRGDIFYTKYDFDNRQTSVENYSLY